MPEREGSNHLADLAGRVRDADQVMQVAARQAAEQALEVGRLLIEAKEACRDGQWRPFLGSTGISERKAQRLMQLVRSGLEPATLSDLGLKGALNLLAMPRRPAARPFEGDVITKTHVVGRHRNVTSVRSAALCLMAEWPEKGRGPAYSAALKACDDALAREVDVEAARLAFIAAAKEVGIFVRADARKG
jgi:Protein of unknown function (DUF982)/Protein of unknown function (DUF3102)